MDLSNVFPANRWFVPLAISDQRSRPIADRPQVHPVFYAIREEDFLRSRP